VDEYSDDDDGDVFGNLSVWEETGDDEQDYGGPNVRDTDEQGEELNKSSRVYVVTLALYTTQFKHANAQRKLEKI
jgi:hypothetical protein